VSALNPRLLIWAGVGIWAGVSFVIGFVVVGMLHGGTPDVADPGPQATKPEAGVLSRGVYRDTRGVTDPAPTAAKHGDMIIWDASPR
jgi:hypothetical protein